MLLTFQDELRDMSVDESVFSLQNALLALKDIALRKARKAAMFRARKRMQQEIITMSAAGNNQQGVRTGTSEDQRADEHQTAVAEADNARLSNKSSSSPQNKLAPEILRLIENSVAFAKTATILFSANNTTAGELELQTGTAEEVASTSPADERNRNSASNGTTENKSTSTLSKSTSKKISSAEEQKIGIDLNFLESLIDCLDLVLLGTTLYQLQICLGLETCDARKGIASTSNALPSMTTFFVVLSCVLRMMTNCVYRSK